MHLILIAAGAASIWRADINAASARFPLHATPVELCGHWSGKAYLDGRGLPRTGRLRHSIRAGSLGQKVHAR